MLRAMELVTDACYLGKACEASEERVLDWNRVMT